MTMMIISKFVSASMPVWLWGGNVLCKPGWYYSIYALAHPFVTTCNLLEWKNDKNANWYLCFLKKITCQELKYAMIIIALLPNLSLMSVGFMNKFPKFSHISQDFICHFQYWHLVRKGVFKVLTEQRTLKGKLKIMSTVRVPRLGQLLHICRLRNDINFPYLCGTNTSGVILWR